MTSSEKIRVLRVAIIGCGQISRLHVQRLQSDGRGRIVGLFDSNRPAAEALRSLLPDKPAVAGSLEELLAESSLDAAIICTPTSAHFEQVRACRGRGLHVLCEKPLADTRDCISQLIDESHSGPQLSVAYQRRYWSRYRTLRREVQSGRWGPVRAVTLRSVEAWQPAITGTWRDDPAINFGGFIADAGSHKIDGVFYVTGLNATEVFAHTYKCGSNVEICATASARLEGGIPLSLNFIGNAQYLGEDLHVHCADADLMIRDEGLWIGRDGHVEPFGDMEGESNPVTGFIDCIEGSGPAVAPPDCALPVFDFTQALLESGRTRQLITISGP